MKTKTHIYVTTRFVGYHRWVNAPIDVKFLSDYHRHVFHVKVEVNVKHNDRDVEFFQLQRDVDFFLKLGYSEAFFEFSCEQLAERIINSLVAKKYDVRSCEVSEDGENGAVVVVESID